MEPLARYHLRTPPTYWVVFALLLALAVGAVAVLFLAAGAVPRSMTFESLLVVLMLALVVAAPVVHYRRTAYRVGGGSGELQLFRDHIEIPPAAPGPPVILELRDLRIHRMKVIVDYTILHVPVGSRTTKIARLESGAQRRSLSGRLFENETYLDALLDDIASVRRGGVALGPRRPTVPPPPRDPTLAKYYDQIEEDLREMR